MESERAETYERIPWETLEAKQNDRKWLVYAIAGAVTVGALAYSFARSQPVDPASIAIPSTAPQPTVPEVVTVPPTVASPVVVTEADLFAVDPDVYRQTAATHAELAAMEYFSSDGSASLMPASFPQAVVPDGVSVFVDWVGSAGVVEVDPTNFEVQVVVRSLLAHGDGAFVRQPTQRATFVIGIDGAGNPYVTGAPVVEEVTFDNESNVTLSVPPTDIAASVEAEHGPVLGGIQDADGSWRLVVMKTGPDGIQRPTTVIP